MLCFYTGNDFRDNAVTTRFGSRVDPFLLPDAFAYRDPAALPPRVQRRDQGWLRDPVTGAVVPQPRNHLVTELARKSFLARRLVSRLLRLHGRWSRDLAIIDLDDQHYYYEIGFFQHRSEPTFQQSIRLALHCLDELHRAVLGDGAELVLVVLPSDLQLVDAELSKTFAELELGEPDFGELDRRRVNRILEAHAAERGIPHLDLWDEFASNPAPERLYLSHEGDRHLSGEGHRVAGAAIAQFLRRHAQSLTDPAVDAYREGVAQAEAGLDSLALGSLSRAVDSSSGWAAPHLALGDLLFRRGRSAAARDAYEMALRAAPESDHILKALGDAHWALADSARALASYRRAAELRPNDLIHREKLVVFAHRNGRADEVAVERAKITEFLQRLDEPAWDGVRQGFADRLYGEGTATIDSELAGHYLRRAAAEYERLLARVPDATLRSNLGSTYLHLGRIDEARSLFESAALDGASAEGHYNLAIVLTRDGDHEQAAAHFRRAAELQPEGETYFRLGNSLGRAGDLRGAVTAHREAQRLSPSVLKYAFSLAAALAILGNAEQEAGDAQASREAWEEARRTLTSLLAAGGRHPQAQALLTRIETVLDR
jgi:tetratricopeptide (TPR) repeat protein